MLEHCRCSNTNVVRVLLANSFCFFVLLLSFAVAALSNAHFNAQPTNHSGLCAHCMSAASSFCRPPSCSLPVVEDMSSEDALYVLKAAATYDGRLLAATNGKAKDNQRVWGTYEGLAEQLVEADALELFSHVINYRWLIGHAWGR